MSKRPQAQKPIASRRTKAHQTFVEDLRKGSRTSRYQTAKPATRQQIKNDIRRGVEDI